MTSPAPTARPATAAVAWVYRGELYIEYPTKTGVPYIVRQRRTPEALALALGVLIENPDPTPRSPISAQASHPAVSRSYRQSATAAKATAEQRAKALEVLLKMGIKP